MKKLIALSILACAVFSACSSDDDDPTLKVSLDNVEIESAGGSAKVSISSNETWEVTIADGAEWCSVSPTSGSGNGTLTLTVEANGLLEERTTQATVKGATLTKTISIVQAAAAMDELLIGSWEMTAQNSGDSGYDDLIGMVVDLKEDKTAVVTLDAEIPGVGTVDKIEGTWELEDKTLSVNGTLAGVPMTLTLTINEIGDDVMACNLGSNLPGIFPSEGIPVDFRK